MAQVASRHSGRNRGFRLLPVEEAVPAEGQLAGQHRAGPVRGLGGEEPDLTHPIAGLPFEEKVQAHPFQGQVPGAVQAGAEEAGAGGVHTLEVHPGQVGVAEGDPLQADPRMDVHPPDHLRHSQELGDLHQVGQLRRILGEPADPVREARRRLGLLRRSPGRARRRGLFIAGAMGGAGGQEQGEGQAEGPGAAGRSEAGAVRPRGPDAVRQVSPLLQVEAASFVLFKAQGTP